MALLVGPCVCLVGATSVLLVVAVRDSGILRAVPIVSVLRYLSGIILLAVPVAICQHLTLRNIRWRMNWQGDTIAALQLRADYYERLAVLDPLTGLFNRRYGSQFLVREIARALRRNYTLTVLLIDLNEFKSLNDRFGHAAGDEAICTFARQLKRAIRSSDVAVRIGGDEFMVILPECNRHSVPTALARLRNLSLCIQGAEIPLTFASGWAELRPGESASQLLDRAERALCGDKCSGESQAKAHRVAADTERSGKLQILGQLTGRVAHDFNNLLSIIKGYSEMVLPALDGHEAARGKVAQIAKAAEQARDLIYHLRAFTSKGSRDWKIFELNDHVQDLMSLLQPLLGERIRLFVATGARARVRAKTGQIEQIVLNMVINAKDAISGRGSIYIRTEPVVLDEWFALRHPGSRAGRYVALSVRDNGGGMDQETLSRIFEPYFTTKPQGSGVGLTTVFELVKQLDGYISAESRPQQGATFTVYLPLAGETGIDRPASDRREDEHPIGVVAGTP